MNMNVNPVGFGAKLPVSRIKVPNKVNTQEPQIDNYVREMLEQHGHKIEDVARFVNRDVVIVQRKGKVAGKPFNVVYANSGPITTRIDLNEMQYGKELIDGIIRNLMANSKKL